MGNLQENTTNDSGMLFDEASIVFDSVIEGIPNTGDDHPVVVLDAVDGDNQDYLILSRSIFEDFIAPTGDDIIYEFYSQSDLLFMDEEFVLNSVLNYEYTFNDFETKTYPKINWIKQQPVTNGWVKMQEVT